MTEIFLYEELTWPEIAALPRDTPLLIPVGNPPAGPALSGDQRSRAERGFDPEKLASPLGGPPRIGLLPAIPYGWRGSGLAVPLHLLGACVSNLVHSLRDDGFSHVYALLPQGLFEPNEHPFDAPYLTYPAAPAPQNQSTTQPFNQSTVVLIPIGHTEQHGHHLPMNTDTVIIDAIARGTQAAAPGEVLALPVFPYGVSTHRASFAGTLNAGGRAFEDFWLAVIDTLVARGFDKIYLISGHGGNCSFLVNIVKYAGERHRRIFAATAWLHTSDRLGVEAITKTRKSKIGGMGHAGELETAYLLHLWPNLVHMERCIDEIDFVATASYMMDWVEAGALVANPPWDDDTATGAYGAGSVATAENGRLWLAAAIAEKIDHVHQIQEQQRRREEKRNAGFGLWGHR